MSTPAPVETPPYLKTTMKAESFSLGGSLEVPEKFSGEDNWIVGYGYGPNSKEQYEELFDSLAKNGKIERHIYGGNWIAVQYSSRCSVEKALSSQSIFSAKLNIYFGVSRVSPERLRILRRQQEHIDTPSNIAKTADERSDNRIQTNGTFSNNLKEDDILLLEDETGREDRPSKPSSICEKLLSWYFGWNYEHPHSD
jgi:hypothetical protein